MSGGNDYRLADIGDSLEKKVLKREVYAFVQNDSLFLNCVHHELGPWYSLVLNRGEFLVFRAAMTGHQAAGYAVLGGAIGGAIAAGKRYLYILSMKTGNSRELTAEYLIARFKDRGKPELLAAFNAEADHERDATLLKYVELLNASLAGQAPASGQ